MRTRQREHLKVYWRVLEELPAIFLPFIIAVPLIACSDALFQEVKYQLGEYEGTCLSVLLLADLNVVATKKGLSDTSRFKTILHNLRALVSLPSKPDTVVRADSTWLFNAVDVDKARILFNETFFTFVEESPRRLREKEENMVQLTHCIQMSFARNNNQVDATMQLDVKFNSDLVQRLFPEAWSKFAVVHNDFQSVDSAGQFSGEQIFDNACFTFKGASVRDLPCVFGHQISQAIERSQLRKWEAENFLLQTTDCVSMDVSRAYPNASVLRLRIASSDGVLMASKLYSVTS
ncbi:hypothetical protein CBS63078_11066 [Aspergillus niger]|nr:hypothetical protein CBS63078_11066 [Aspergillus niger]